MRAEDRLMGELCKVCPGTYLAWPIGKAPSLPWFTYRWWSGGEVFADDENYAQLRRMRIELYFKELDLDLIDDFEDALKRVGTYSLYDATFVNTENCYRHVYRLACRPVHSER